MGNCCRIARETLWLAVALCCTLGITASQSGGDVIIDNGDPGTSYTGIWELSGGTSPYGGDSLWARDGATYTWSINSQPAGDYEVLMWWSAWPSRATAINVGIQHAGGTTNRLINQLQNAGRWNSLGQYYFDGSGRVTIVAASGSTVSTCADAVWFRLIDDNAPPSAHISSISPNPAAVGETIVFAGYGDDSDGQIVAYKWSSNVDGHLSNAAGFSTSSLSQGVHEISFEVQDDKQEWSAPAKQILTVGAVPVELIIDNRDANTSRTGVWEVSGGSDPWGPDSVWSRDGGTFTWHFNPPKSGQYQVSMWWTEWPSRSSSVPVSIVHAGGTTNLTVNQQTNGGKWNVLGGYSFTAGVQGSVTLRAPASSPTSYCADAVKFTFVEAGNEPPVAVIGSISPNPADIGQTVTFTGHGSDADGSVIAYYWQSNIDGVLSDLASFSINTLSQGTHEISFAVQDDMGQWSQPANASLTVIGLPAADVVVDNRDANTSRTGVWEVSGGPNPWGPDSVWSRDGGTFTWYFNPPTSGQYQVSMWWTEWSSRSASVPVSIIHAGGTTNLTVNQQTNGGKWNVLGVYGFTQGVQGAITLTAPNAAPTSYCADAVKFSLLSGSEVPVAVIDSISPNPAETGQTVSFAGHGTDSDGGIVAYRWESSIDGELSTSASFATSSLSAGTHEVSFFVQDDAGQWSQPAKRVLVIGGIQPTEIVIDNGDPRTSYTGVWLPSGAPNCYGNDSLYSRDGTTYTWTFSPPLTGLYELSMWWTQWSSRTTNARVLVATADGTSTVYINQQTNGGKWNRLGEFYYEAGTNYNVIITSSPGPASTCADAVRFVKVAQAGPPVASFYADNIRGGAPYSVQFHDQSSGEVNQWLWDFGDGQTSTQRSPRHTYNQAGVHTVSLTVTGPHGTSRKTEWDYIDIKPRTTEHVYLVDGYAGNNYFIPDITQMMRRLNATETTSGWRYQPSNSNMTYYMHRVRTPEAMENALKEQDAHVIVVGHANFGFGTTFANSTEILNQRIDNIRYVDDDRFVNYSTDMVSTKIDGMKYGQAYPNWEPIFKDGTSALMPYDFGDPRGNPPYNYYLTYRVPGDPMVYRIEMANGKYLERFPDASTPVWFSEDGSPPDPVQNPEFFIRNTDADYNRCDFVGNWVIKKAPSGGYSGESGYLGYNYHARWPGSGQNKAIYTLVVEHPGLYAVMGSWYPDPTNASNARYTIVHGQGTSVAYANQRQTQLINPIGVYYFGKGSYTVTLDDFANGQVIADAIALNPLENPEQILLTDFAASDTRGQVGLEVGFSSRNSYFNLANPLGGVVEWNWDFGDGSSSSEANPTHVYSAAGVYTVSLTVKDAIGNTASEVKPDFIAVGTPGPLRAQFTALNRIGSDRVVTRFTDQSSGNITSWHWDFGDGKTSNEQNPVHLYDQRGIYTVKLTVSGPGGSDTRTKTDYAYNLIGIIYADNTSQGKPHFYQRDGLITFPKVICYTGDVKISTAQMKYTRMFHSACNSFPYFAEAFNRGVMFAKTGDVKVHNDTAVPYLEYYLRGYTDRDILAYINTIENNHEYYNFNEKPPSMRMR